MSTERDIYPHNGSDHRAPGQIEQNIQRTRDDMDRTLDEIADRLNPRHLIDGVMELFSSDEASRSEWARQVRRSGKQGLRKIKRNPLPALLVGAGIAYLMMEDDEEERSESFVGPPSGQPYRASGQPGVAAAAWHENYDWSTAEFDEQSWTPRAESTLAEIQAVTLQTNLPASERVRTTAAKVLSLSGRSRSEIREALHAQWDEIPEHSGSFVDARTGRPYDESYGKDWRQLAAAEALVSAPPEDHEAGWSERAEAALKHMQASIGDTGASAKQKLSAISEQIGSLGESSRSFASRYGQAASRYGQAAKRRAGSMSRATRHGVQTAGRQVSDGYAVSRDYVAETVDEHPLAAGAAVLGLGLLIGSLLPRTAREDQVLGETADNAKARAAEAGYDALERGQRMAESAGSAAMEEMERQGLKPSQIVHGARETAAAVKHAVAENVPSAGEVRHRVDQVAEAAGNSARQETQRAPNPMDSPTRPT